MTKAKKWAARIGLCLFSIVITLLLGEFAFRWKVSAWPFEKPDVDLPWMTEKDKPLRWRFSATDGRNSLGLRNKEITPKEPNARRILFLGDSLVWMGETTAGPLYTEIIEGRLNEAVRGMRKIEVINAGVLAYTTYQELEFLKLYGLDMEPDLVILGFVLNDLYCPYVQQPIGGLALAPLPCWMLHSFDTTRMPGKLFAHSYLAHQTYRVFQRAAHPSVFPFDYNWAAYLAWKPYGWGDAERLIGEMAQILHDRDIPLMVVSFPLREQVDETFLRMDPDYVLYPQSRLKEICTENDIPLLDLHPALHTGGADALFRDYCHLHPPGNDIVANQVTTYLLKHTSLWIGSK